MAQVTELLKSKKFMARAYAAEALGRMGAPASGSIKQLEATLQDEDQEVREAAQEALQKIRQAVP